MLRRIELFSITLMLFSLGSLSLGYDSIDTPMDTYFEGYVTDAYTGEPIQTAEVDYFTDQNSGFV